MYSYCCMIYEVPVRQQTNMDMFLMIDDVTRITYLLFIYLFIIHSCSRHRFTIKAYTQLQIACHFTVKFKIKIILFLKEDK